MKPENILFEASGRPLLADLGLSKHFDRDAPGASQSVALTASGTAKGTAGYMAPEQIEDAASVGPPADVFALGAVLWECLAGVPAFEGENPIEVAAKIGSGILGRIDRPDVPAWLEAVLERALSVEARERFPDGATFARALAGPAGHAPRDRRVLALILVLVLAGAMTILALVQRPEPPPAPALPDLDAEVAAIESRIEALRFGEAVEHARRLAREHPEAALAHYELGLALASSEKFRDALPEVTRSIELDPRSARGWSLRAACHVGTQDLERALADVAAALERDPREARAFEVRGSVHLVRRELEAAEEDLARAAEIHATTNGLSALAQAHVLDGKYDEALHDLDRALAFAPRDALLHGVRADVEARRGDFEAALVDCDRALAIDPREDFALSVKSKILLRQRRFEEALALADTAVSAAPDAAAPRLSRAEARFLAGDFEGSREDADHVLALIERDPLAHRLRAQARFKLGDIAGAREDAHRYAELAPENPDVGPLLELVGDK